MLPGELLVTGTDGAANSSSRCDAAILNTSRDIRHVLVMGYDTNKCVIDKPCGTVTLSAGLAGRAELILVRDATLGEYGWFGNSFYGQIATTNMLELNLDIPSVLLADLFVGAGLAQNASALANLT